MRKQSTVALPHEMGIQHGKGQGAFTESVPGLPEASYGEITQEIKSLDV